MAKEILDTGTVANDNTGDTLRQGGTKINDNFTEIYDKIGDGTNITFNVNTLSLDTLSDVNLSTPPTLEQYLQFNGSQWVPVTHEVDGAVTGHLVPNANVAYDLGSPTLAFRDLYLSSSSIHLGGVKLSANSTTGLVLEKNGVELTPAIDYDNLSNKPTLVTSFNDLADQPTIPAGDLSTANNAQTLENKTLGSSSPTHIDGDLLPTRDIQFDLGSPSNRFRDLYLSSSSMHIGGTKLSTAGGSLQTFDVVYNGNLIPTLVQDWNSFQYDGNPRKSTTITSAGIIPHVVNAPHGAAKIEDGYEARLIAKVSQPVDIFKKYPNIEQYEEVNEQYCSTINPESSDNWFKDVPWVFSDWNNILEITVYELEADTKYKLVYKFMTGDWPVDVETVLCEWIITKDSLGNTKFHATANSKKIWTHYHTEFDTKFAFYDVDGNLDPTATMFVDGIGIENNLSFASGNRASTLTTNPFISGDANSAPLFGSHLQHSLLQISGPNSFFVNAQGLTAAHRPPVANNITELQVTLEADGADTFLRLYGLESHVGAFDYLNTSYPATNYENNEYFLSEFKFVPATSTDVAKLTETSRTRPVSWNSLRWVNVVEYSDKTTSLFGANTVLHLNSTASISVNTRLDIDNEPTATSDLEEIFFNNSMGSAKISFDHFDITMPYPGIGAFVTPNFSYEDLLTQYAIPSTANTVNLFKADQLDTVDLSKLPYKETPVGLDQRFQPNFDLEVSLYYNQSDDVPFVTYSQLSNKYYNFDAAGALNHLPNDNDSQGLILDNLGNLYFKARDENTIRTHFARADKFKISLKSSAPVREFSNFLDDIELDANAEDNKLYLQSNTEIYAVNSENIEENCDIATILGSATSIEIEITKEIVDTTTTDAIADTNSEVANTKADVVDIQNELTKSLRLTNLPVPTSNTAAGTLGDMVVDGNTLYICVANDQWGKINLDFNW